MERIVVSLKGANQLERSNLLREQELLMKINANLEKDIPIRELTLTDEESSGVLEGGKVD